MCSQSEFGLLREYLKRDKLKIPNSERVSFVMNSYQIIKKIIDKNDSLSTVEILPCALGGGDVTIRIIAPEVTVYNLQGLISAIKEADIVNIYPTTDDRIKIDLQFRNVYRVIVL